MRTVLTLGVSPWRRDVLRTSLWFVPSLLLIAIIGLFAATYSLDLHVYDAQITLPAWIQLESADGARTLLSGLAAGVITVLGVVFSVTIVALTLASQQFGPRMLRNFVRDLGTQLTLGAFVATFVYSVLTLGSIGGGSRSVTFVPQISVSVSLALVFVNVMMLIYFIHHITLLIQLPAVISSIASTLAAAIDLQFPTRGQSHDQIPRTGRPLAELLALLDAEGAEVVATTSGYLQFVGHARLVEIMERHGAVVQLIYRPGHFITRGLPLARVWPPSAADAVLPALARAHITGPHRTLEQDAVFAIDQLVEIAIRALSTAVNDTFTALTCIDWLADGLCMISERELPDGLHRDRAGAIRVIELAPSYERMVNRAYDKVRQSGVGMTAVSMRLLEGLARAVAYAQDDTQRAILHRQADMIMRGCESAITDPDDLEAIRGRYRDAREGRHAKPYPAPPA
ncbi:DUF2254 domain-containing protein [Sinomonas sp. ASV322]|uniref:DUF2254 domain-containing protein n=1 Tax=Sinomonas sp. ASV322 TaxID=3041920 RepID=UPI0027DAE777|nr:DUF2254 domain-containing protein [Sinomonas sp. ASV322]MDQ4504617.1 DUF2254 domain-containing protein [Sinomonas sp. ASV322]